MQGPRSQGHRMHPIAPSTSMCQNQNCLQAQKSAIRSLSHIPNEFSGLYTQFREHVHVWLAGDAAGICWRYSKRSQIETMKLKKPSQQPNLPPILRAASCVELLQSPLCLFTWIPAFMWSTLKTFKTILGPNPFGHGFSRFLKYHLQKW